MRTPSYKGFYLSVRMSSREARAVGGSRKNTISSVVQIQFQVFHDSSSIILIKRKMALYCHRLNPFYAPINSTILTSPGQPTGILPSSIPGEVGNLNLAWLGWGIWTGSVKIIQLVEVQRSKTVHNQTCLVHSMSSRLMFPTFSPLLKC